MIAVGAGPPSSDAKPWHCDSDQARKDGDTDKPEQRVSEVLTIIDQKWNSGTQIDDDKDIESNDKYGNMAAGKEKLNKTWKPLNKYQEGSLNMVTKLGWI